MAEIFRKNDQLKFRIDELRKSGHSVGFVPTLGALHEGHMSLIAKALKETDIVVCSIFVNPSQFNEAQDFKNYPRTIEKDIRLLEKNGCHIVYIPSVKSVYPSNYKAPGILLNGLDEVMEGANRPGHFKGVIEVVYRLFELVNPDKAFFGEKDFQQLTIIRHMVRSKKLPVDIIGCPIIREKDGLAMSSRNRLLTRVNRKKAPILFKALRRAKLNRKKLTPFALKKDISHFLSKEGVDLEYFEIADEEKLHPVKRWFKRKNARAFVTARFGKIRLIDNMRIHYRPK